MPEKLFLRTLGRLTCRNVRHLILRHILLSFQAGQGLETGLQLVNDRFLSAQGLVHLCLFEEEKALMTCVQEGASANRAYGDGIYDEAQLRLRTELGEDSSHRFLRGEEDISALAAEIAALANSAGGWLYLGLSPEGHLRGIARSEVARLNRLLVCAAQSLTPPVTVLTSNILLSSGRVAMVVRVQAAEAGLLDSAGICWVKNGAGKASLSRSQMSALNRSADTDAVSPHVPRYERRDPSGNGSGTETFVPDIAPVHDESTARAESPVQSAQVRPQMSGEMRLVDERTDTLDWQNPRDYVRGVLRLDWPADSAARLVLLQRMKLARGNRLTVAGALLFSDSPQTALPQARVCLRTVLQERQPPEEVVLHGPVRKLYDEAQARILQALAAAGDSQQIPPGVFTELLVNALVHRDYLSPDPIRIDITPDSVRIVSPGGLVAPLDVQSMDMGINLCRNPVLASHAGKGFLSYRGLGMGIRRVLSLWPQVVWTVSARSVEVRVLRRIETPAEAASEYRPEQRTVPAQEAWHLAQETPEPGDAGECAAPGSAGISVAEPVSADVDASEGLEESSLEPRSADAGPSSATSDASRGEGQAMDWNSSEGRVAREIFRRIEANPDITTEQLARETGVCKRTVIKRLALLKDRGALIRHGSSRGGHWEIVPGRVDGPAPQNHVDEDLKNG